MSSVCGIYNSFLRPICVPWTYTGGTVEKIAAWAAFFFIGWIYHPLVAVKRAYFWLTGSLEAPGTQAVVIDPLSRGLAGFDNLGVRGQIHGVYITTNETNLETTRCLLRDHPRVEGSVRTVHIGCATWHNLDIICARRSTYGLIIDFNPKNGEFLRKTVEIIRSSASRRAFIEGMVRYLNSLRGGDRDLFFHQDQSGLPTDRIELELMREGSWLQTEENFLYIKEQLVATDRIVAITEDITNDETISNIRRFLDTNQIAIDTLYMSNICNFMNTQAKKTAFVRSVRQLLNRDTLFISCPRLRHLDTLRTTILEQRPLLGREILADSYQTERLFEESV